MTKRVMHVIESLEMGGAENVVANIVNHTSDGFEPMICCVKRSGPVAKAIKRPGVKIFELGKGEGNSIALPFRLAALLRDHRVDVVQIHNWGPFCEAVAGAVLAGTPKIFQMSHGGFHPYPAGARFRPFKIKFRHAVERILSFWVTRFIAVSEKMRQEIMAEIGIPAEKIVVIRNGVDVSGTGQNAELKKAELGIAAGDRVIGSVGRLVTGKNYEFLLECFSQIKERAGGRLKLILIGDGPERSALESTVRRLGLEKQVFTLGERSDARDWLGAMDVFVLPSLYEGVSIALLEAMAAKRPVVALRVGGNPEIVRHGETGLLAEPGQADEFVKAVAGLLNDEKRRIDMGEKGFELVRERYSLQSVVKEYEALYNG